MGIQCENMYPGVGRGKFLILFGLGELNQLELIFSKNYKTPSL